MQLNESVLADAQRRSDSTGRSLRHSMRRETLRRRRQIEEGKLIAGNQQQIPSGEVSLPQPTSGEVSIPKPPIAETPIPAPGAQLPDVPKPTQNLDGDTAETKPEPKKTGKPKKKIETEGADTGVTASSAGDDTAPPEGKTDGDWKNDPEFVRKEGNIGRRVQWTAFGKATEGNIAYVIPTGKTPHELGIGAGTAKSAARTEHSYVVKTDEGSLVWPALKGLTVVPENA